MKPPAPTIRTVAQHAGVGIGTVSRVLNGGVVSQHSREKVVKAIAALGFTPHAGARSLARSQSCTIGLVVNSTRGSWFSELIAGVEEALSQSRRSVLIGSLRLSGVYDPRVIFAWIGERRVDGLLFVRFSRKERPLLEAATAAGLPVALIAPDDVVAGAIEVRAENVTAGEIAARHLLELGHRRIAFLGGPKASVDTKERLDGLSSALGKQELTPDSVWFAPNYYHEGAAEFAAHFLASRTRPTAVVCACDALALGLSKALLDAGLAIPDDVSLLGFDNSPESAFFWPGLTSVAQPSRQMAARACAELLSKIDGAPVARQSRLGVELVARQSTGRAPPGSG